jgi:predicted phosphodiesterase
MKTLLMTDLHHNDDTFLTHYAIKYLNNMIDIIETQKIKRVIILGDWSDKRSYMHYKSLAIFTPLYYKMMELVDHFYFIMGNHDSTYHNVNDIFSAKEIFEYASNQIKCDVRFIQDDVLVLDDEKIVLCPWIPKENNEKIISDIMKYNKSDYILLGHFELSGFQTNDKYIMTSSQLKRSTYNKYDKVISGHYHLNQTKRNVVYLGSPYQTKFGEGTNHETFILNNKRELKSVYMHDDIFIELYIKEFDNDNWLDVIDNIDNKKVKISIDSDDNDVINKIINYVNVNYKPIDVKYFFRNKEFAFEEIEVENKSNEENEIDFFNTLILDDDIEEEVKKRFYVFKNDRS